MSEDLSKLKHQALALLARREHAVNELRQKLARKSTNMELIEQVLREMVEANYLNEQRYVEMMLRSRYAKGHGPMRFKQEVKQHQVPDHMIQDALAEFDGDWYELAQLTREKRFGLWEGGDYKERARQMRFLASRGFYPDHIDAAF